VSAENTELVVIGTVHHVPTPEALEVLANVAVVVNDAGIISAV